MRHRFHSEDISGTACDLLYSKAFEENNLQLVLIPVCTLAYLDGEHPLGVHHSKDSSWQPEQSLLRSPECPGLAHLPFPGA